MLKEMQEVKNIETLTRDELLDILYVEYVKASIKEAEEDFKNGRFMTLEESMKRFNEYANSISDES